jgi:hypothetical protein
MKALINLSLMRREKDQPEIFVFDPDQSGKTKINYENVFGKEKFILEEMGFSELVNSPCFKKIISL